MFLRRAALHAEQDQVCAPTDVELGQEFRDVEFYGAQGNVQAIKHNHAYSAQIAIRDAIDRGLLKDVQRGLLEARAHNAYTRWISGSCYGEHLLGNRSQRASCSRDLV